MRDDDGMGVKDWITGEMISRRDDDRARSHGEMRGRFMVVWLSSLVGKVRVICVTEADLIISVHAHLNNCIPAGLSYYLKVVWYMPTAC